MSVSKPIKITLLLGSRNDVIAFSRMLGRHLDMSARPDAGAPAIISVHGSEGGGKSLISEKIAETVSGLRYNFNNSMAHNRRFTSRADYEMQFLDISYSFLEGQDKHLKQNDRIDDAVAKRNKSGITFVHNAALANPDLYDLDIRMCEIGVDNKDSFARLFNDNSLGKISHEFLEQQGLAAEYASLCKANGAKWVRYVEMEIRNPDIFTDAFLEAIPSLADPKTRYNLGAAVDRWQSIRAGIRNLCAGLPIRKPDPLSMS